jgi:hypothetical protein
MLHYLQRIIYATNCEMTGRSFGITYFWLRFNGLLLRIVINSITNHMTR